MCAATLMRSAMTRLPEWRPLLQMLEREAGRCLSLQDLGLKKRYPSFWKAPAFAEQLSIAANGFSTIPEYKAA
eukprot:6770774-Pyramimonas_sp.AAC.1